MGKTVLDALLGKDKAIYDVSKSSTSALPPQKKMRKVHVIGDTSPYGDEGNARGSTPSGD